MTWRDDLAAMAERKRRMAEVVSAADWSHLRDAAEAADEDREAMRRFAEMLIDLVRDDPGRRDVEPLIEMCWTQAKAGER